MKLCMIGTGYVGLVSGVCFSDLGNDVICVDKDINKINLLKKGRIPIYEPGLSELAIKNYKNKRLSFSSDLKKSVKNSDIIFICVGTPTKKNGSSADLTQVLNVAKELSSSINKFKIIITKSTVPVTTGDEIEKIILKKNNKNFDIVSNPEFLREGEAIRDFRFPDRIIIGSENNKIFKVMKKLYLPLINKGSKYFTTSRRGAELIKYASNAFLATKITFINELSNLCEKSNINIEDISLGMGSDLRIGSRFLRAGPAYGGSCFPKDTKGLASTGDKFKINLSIVKTVIKSNEERIFLHTKRINHLMGFNLKGKKIAFLGVTFKPNTDDMRGSTSLKMIPYVCKKGAKVIYYDPSGKKVEFDKFKNCHFSNDIKETCKDSNLIILHTDWDEFKFLDFKKLNHKKNFQIYDLRNLYDYKDMNKNNIKYHSIGRPLTK